MLSSVKLQHGILIGKITPFSYDIIGFYFTPIDGETKCLLLDPTFYNEQSSLRMRQLSDPVSNIIKRSHRTLPLSKILSSGAFSKISYRELINPSDSKRFKLALVNMQSSFDNGNIYGDIIGDSWHNYASAHIDYISKAIGQNPSERVKQCSGECYIGPLPDIQSYDPFGPVKIYHRDIPLITEEDKQWIKRWTDFFNISYSIKANLTYNRPQTINSSVTFASLIEQDPSIFCPNDTLFQAFLTNIIDDGTVAGHINPIKMPLSFRVPTNYIFSEDVYNNEKMKTTWGLNIYDAACWEISLWLLNDNHSLLLDEIRSSRKTTQFASIISNNVNSQKANQYLAPISIKDNTEPDGPVNPKIRNTVYPYDPNGFSFQIISNYYSYDPITIHPQPWSNSAKYWNEFKATCGENAWFFGLAPFIRNFNTTNFKGYSGFISTLFNMMDVNGGFYYSPMSSSINTWSLSTEDNASMYGTLSHMKAHIQSNNLHRAELCEERRIPLESNTNIDIGVSIGQINTMMIGIKQFFSSMADHDNFFFYRAKSWIEDSNEGGLWQINTEGIKVLNSVGATVLLPFTVTSNDVNMPYGSDKNYVVSVNVQTWSICSLQPSVIDEIFGVTGATLRMWNNLKRTCGRFNYDGELKGFGYTNIKSSYDEDMGSVISGDWTFAAMMACKVIKSYYGDMADINPYSISSDLAELESFMYTINTGITDDHLLFVSRLDEAYFNYANIRAQSGLGWFANPIPSITSTAWHIFYTKSFNPFVPQGSILR